MDDLIGRFEEPNGSRRWDQPLFTVGPDDNLPLDEIVSAVISGKVVKSSMATEISELKETNFLYELDRVTKDVLKAVSSAQSSGNVAVGDLLAVPHTDHFVMLSRSVGLPEMKRIQTQFVKISKANPPSVVSAFSIASAFVDYINSSIISS